ncbi:Alpha/Beta hydrolase protein [Xylaria arbuscula]|nr:Alpha/Beta hydrolase protein [Xylaria arbuscula]
MHQFFAGNFFNFEVIRILGMTASGGADIGECLDAVDHIRENDPTSWQEAWSEQAESASRIAMSAQHDRHRNAARSAFLRAANYTRASAYMMTGKSLGSSDPRVAPILRKAAELFHSATQLQDSPAVPIQIPYEDGGISLPGYLYLPPASCRLPGGTPVLVNFVGADSTQEEQYYMFPAAGPELGYAVLTFDGPGQGLNLHEHGLPLRADWEAVAQAVFDHLYEYASEHPELELNMEQVAVAGASLGGYFALRSAADRRCKACVAIDPMYDLYAFGAKHVAPTFFGLWDRGWIPDCVVDAAISLGTRLSFQMRWEIFTSSRFLGVSTPTALLRAMQRFTLQQGDGKTGTDYLGQLKCPTFVTGAAKSLYFEVADHTDMVFGGIQHREKECWVGLKPGNGGLQAKMGAVALCSQRVFAFLDRTFGVKRQSVISRTTLQE